MKAQITVKEDIIIVRLKGVADFESVDSLEHTCKNYFLKKKIIFNLEGLNFVGSSGLANLSEIIKKLSLKSNFKMCNVGSEFQKIFADSRLKSFTFYEDESSAERAFL